MRVMAFWIGAIACFSPLSGSHAQPFQQTATVVKAGEETRIGLINPFDLKTCKPRDDEVARIAREPQNGRAEIRREPVILTSKECGILTIQGYAIYYQPEAGFVGRASLAFELRNNERNTTDVYFFPVEVR
jgi:hypothetical protein